MSNLILQTAYDETPYVLLNLYEDAMINGAAQIREGDIDALAVLTRVAAIMGLCTFFSGTTHFGSMAEHGISHYIDMFSKDKHPGTSHGEQVGIATMTISKMQNTIFLGFTNIFAGRSFRCYMMLGLIQISALVEIHNI